MKLYKLTDEKHQTKNQCQWGDNVTHSVEKDLQNTKLCSAGVIHASKNQNLALLLNSIHANISDPVLWEAKGEVVVENWEKVGCHELTTIRQMDLPDWYTDPENRKQVMIQFAVLCAESVLAAFEERHPKNDEPRKAIEAIKKYLKNPSPKAAASSRIAGNNAHWIDTAGDAAFYAADIPARTVFTDLSAATAAANAAEAAVNYGIEIDFNELADEAVKLTD